MPAVLRRSGPDIRDASGAVRTPRAIIKWCDECGAENAPFSEKINGVTTFWCGWDTERLRPVCKERKYLDANVPG